jgi:hypothetical protein
MVHFNDNPLDLENQSKNMKDYVILKELKQREEKLKETKKYLQSEIQQKNEERFRNFNDK